MRAVAIQKVLLREGVWERKCYRCGLTEWLGEPVPLEVNHIDADHDNVELTNLELLCCNCHALTPTWKRGKAGLALVAQRQRQRSEGPFSARSNRAGSTKEGEPAW